MVKYYEDNLRTIYNGDCRHMSELPDESVHCVTTSPPYWGLRKYEGDQDLIWGGDKDCKHQWVEKRRQSYNVDSGSRWQHSSHGDTEEARTSYADWEAVKQGSHIEGYCPLCGTWKGAFGLEPTPELYVQHTIEILREIRRVLRKDGVVFWNIGDSYFGSWADYSGKGRTALSSWSRKAYGDKNPDRPPSSYPNPILKPKDLCLIPFRIALAAQSDGWWVRSVIIWHKLNPMPESVKDRPTNSYEFILMLTKSVRYYYDADAVREPLAEATIKRAESPFHPEHWKSRLYRETQGTERDAQTFNQEVYAKIARGEKTHRNLRDVWTFPTTPFPGAHFAVFPESLPSICIKAATSEKGCCPKCGAPWARVIDKKPSQFNIRVRDAWAGRATPEEGYKATEEEIARYPGNHPDMGYRQTLGWRSTCNCGIDNPTACTVLDPFAGSGTTLLVATKLGRKSIGYDISESYCKMAVNRCRQQFFSLT